MIRRILAYGTACLLFLNSCNYFAAEEGSREVARVGEKVLLASELSAVIPSGISEADSIQMAENFITNWIKQQLVLRKAYQNLDGEEIDVEQLVENYRNSLIRNRYEQKLVAQKLDTVISSQEVEAYYKAHSDDFVSNEDLARILFVKVRTDAPKLDELKAKMVESSGQGREFIKEYCVQFCEQSTVADTGHLRVSSVMRMMPAALHGEVQMREGVLQVLTDSVYQYILYPTDIVRGGELAPLNYVHQRIENMIIQQRKVELLKDLENNLYREALKRGQFERFDEN